MKHYNGDYTVLSFSSYVLFLISSIAGINNYFSLIETIIYRRILIGGYIVVGLVFAYFIYFIHKVSTAQNTLMRMTPRYVKGYVTRAVELGIYAENEKDSVLAKVDAEKRITI